MKLPPVIYDVIDQTSEQLSHRPQLQQLFQNCFPNTLETTTKLLDDGTTFVFTGDIPAMWLRDSAEQVSPYLPYLSIDRGLRSLIRGLIDRHLFYIQHDPYTNAFNEAPNHAHWNDDDKAEMTAWVWERKYELDSLCFSLNLIYEYWKQTRDDTVLGTSFLHALHMVVTVWEIEQDHEKRSSYTFERDDCPDIDTLKNNGRGTRVRYTGMTWSGFRPSDDACAYGYHIPANMFAVVVLGKMAEMLRYKGNQQRLLRRVIKLHKEIDQGIQIHGTYLHPDYGKIYAYETDGFGNYALMDDAGTPSLLSIPYIGYRSMDDPIYQNTRRFILSKDNPYFYTGAYAEGLGSPHTPEGYVWHLGISMQALTTNDREELKRLIDMLERTDAGTGYMHEGFHPDDPSMYTREWFAWSNSMCAKAILHAIDNKAI